jgi:pimeloyl-ACP methyl ester carboxylesterase
MISSISPPVAILWGDKDTVTPLDQAQDLQILLPRASLTILSGVGHIPQIEDPIAFNAALVEILRKLIAKQS